MHESYLKYHSTETAARKRPHLRSVLLAYIRSVVLCNCAPYRMSAGWEAIQQPDSSWSWSMLTLAITNMYKNGMWPFKRGLTRKKLKFGYSESKRKRSVQCSKGNKSSSKGTTEVHVMQQLQVKFKVTRKMTRMGRTVIHLMLKNDYILISSV